MSVKVAFSIGSFVFLSSILYTVFKTEEYPPEKTKKLEKTIDWSFGKMLSEIISSIKDMPLTMKKLGLIQFFSWFAFFTMWSMANPALTEHVFHTPAPLEAAFDFRVKCLSFIGSCSPTRWW